jgi:hypothetical protein
MKLTKGKKKGFKAFGIHLRATSCSLWLKVKVSGSCQLKLAMLKIIMTFEDLN